LGPTAPRRLIIAAHQIVPPWISDALWTAE
jgi:hypothetical protein